MKTVILKRFPLPGRFYAINLFGIVFARDRLTETEQRHEFIHTMQQREMLFLGFYMWYVAEWLVRLALYRDAYKAYRNISFEREAYSNEHIKDYRKQRRRYAWLWEINEE